MVLKDRFFFFRSDLLAHKVCIATEELLCKISMRFIQAYRLRNVSVETIDDVETYDQLEDLFGGIFNP